MRVYMVGANPCKLKYVYLSLKDARKECARLNENSRNYTYTVRSFNVKDG